MDQAKLGDRVQCSCKGGPHHIVTGASTSLVDGVPAARVGDKSSCGASITTGLAWYPIEGSPAAIHGSVTSCGGSVVASATAVTGSPSRVGRSVVGLSATEVRSETAIARNRSSLRQDAIFRSSEASSQRPGEQTARKADIIAEPGFVVVRKLTPRSELKHRLLPDAPADIDAMFERLNGHLSDTVLPGSLVVLSDPENLQCTAEEAALLDQARRAQEIVQKLEPAQAQAMVDHWGAMMDLSNELDAASTNLGVTSSGLSQLKSATAEILDELAEAYEIGTAYVRDRAPALWGRFETQARQWIDQPFEMPDAAQDLKAKIGIAADQAVHTVKQALEGFPEFRLPTVSEGIRRASSFAKTMDAANYLAIALDYIATDLRVENACREAALSEECRRVKFVEYGGLIGRTFIGSAGATIGVAGRSLCLAVGRHPAAGLVCAVVASSAGAYEGMQQGDAFGKWSGEVIYEHFYKGKREVDE